MSLLSEVLIADIDVSEDLGVRNLLNHVMIKKNYSSVYSLPINVFMNNASLLRKFQFTLEKYFDARLPTAQINPTMISKINTGFQFLTIAAALCFPIMGYKDHELFLALW